MVLFAKLLYQEFIFFEMKHQTFMKLKRQFHKQNKLLIEEIMAIQQTLEVIEGGSLNDYN